MLVICFHLLLTEALAHDFENNGDGELLKLGIEISERMVSRLMPKDRKPPSQTWRAFLNNHLNDLVSMVELPEAGGLHHRYERRAA